MEKSAFFRAISNLYTPFRNMFSAYPDINIYLFIIYTKTPISSTETIPIADRCYIIRGKIKTFLEDNNNFYVIMVIC